jgi:hypothetical protein
VVTVLRLPLCQGITAIWLGQVTPFAFDAISWKYYTVFIASLLGLSVFYAACLTETNQLSLESIAGQFGDETVALDKAVAAAHEEHGEAVQEKRVTSGVPAETIRDA